MTFAHPWILAIAWLPLAWFVYEWRRGARPLTMGLKAVSLVAILLALAQPSLSVPDTKVAVAVLVDTSSSISATDLERASGIANRIRDEEGSNWMRVIPFARSARTLDPTEQSRIRSTAGEAGQATDLEAAVRGAVASLPSGMVPRVALISDGKENKGSVVRAAWQARDLGIPIDTYALAGRARPALRLESVQLPPVAFTGERFPIDLVVSAPRAENAEVELTAEGRSLGKTPVALAAGVNPLRLHASVNTPGSLELAVAVRAAGDGEVRFNQALTLRRPKVLYVNADAPAENAHLSRTLAAAQFDIERTSDISHSKFTNYQLVILDNWDIERIEPSRKTDLEQYVKQGGGLLVIGGERNNFAEGKKTDDPLARTLPATVAPPRSPEGTALVLIVDKSSSMEGPKMELARQAAAGVVEHLRPIDMVGVLIFDNTFRWAVPIRRAEDRPLIKMLIAGIQPDGGTQIAPALTEAYKAISVVNATYKHVVLLTDGISEEGDSMELARQAKTKNVTISTVGLGRDVNRAYLEGVAKLAAGRSYFLTDPAGLEQILLRDVQEHTGTTSVEKSIIPEVVSQAEILEGVQMQSAPALKGYIRYEPKPSAQIILRVDQKDPLLARWQYGLGRAAVFTSDAKARWAADWVTWPGYDKFWANVTRDLLPHAQAGESTLTFDSANGDLIASYRLGRGVEEPATLPEVFVFGPDGFQQPMPIKKIAAGTYRGRLAIGARQGLFRIRPVAESQAFPEAGIYRPEDELADYGSNEALLRQVAEFTGGRFQPEPSAVFDRQERSIPSTMQLWPGLLAAAVLLSLTDLLLRKWKGIVGQRQPARA